MNAIENPEPSPLEEARDGTYDASVIAEILRDMANADISGSRPMQGTSVEYLAKLLAVAVERVDVALSGLRGRSGGR